MARRFRRLAVIMVCFTSGFSISLGASAQQAAGSQPLNASVSDFGTTFVFSPPPVCAGCLETELGFESLEDARYIPSVATLAFPRDHTDASILLNLLDSESTPHGRVNQFGNRLDFVVRQQVVAKGGFELTIAPRGAVFIRAVDGGRVGATLAPQYAYGKNLAILNLTWTAGIDVSINNPRSDYLTSFDYYRTLQSRGAAFFLGLQHEVAAGQQTIGIEQGLVLPFRNGQVELETAQLNLNTGLQVQVQARVIVNWGQLFKHRKEPGSPL